MKFRILAILLFAVQIGFSQIYIDSYRFASAAPLEVQYLVIGGGGGGGTNGGGGGGAGGYRSSVTGELSGGGAGAEPAFAVGSGISYTVTVGAGGNGSTSAGVKGGNGNNSVFATITSIGGGGGGSAFTGAGLDGGSGGGSGNFDGSSGGIGVANQGYAGGASYTTDGANGGGGGAGGPGANGTSSVSSGSGGLALSSTITGISVARAGGGSGGSNLVGTTGSTTGGGGIGGARNSNGANAVANTGSGGGGGGTGSVSGTGGSGGSGVVILRYPSTYTITNPGGGLTFTTTTVGSDKVTTFTAGTGNIQFNDTPINLLLNDYPGAAAAYSLRKLDKDYTGSAIQIRTTGTGTNQPAGSLANIGFDSNGDLDETTIINHCLGTSCTVQTWYDQSGNGNDATQATAANQPTIYTGGAVTTISGIPAVLWPNYTNAYSLRSTGFNISQPNTIFSAIYFNGTSGRQDYVSDAGVTTNRHFLLHRDSDNKWYSFAGSLLSESSADLTARKLLFTQLYNTSASFIRKNAAQTASGNTGTNSMNGITIGNFSGTISSTFNHSGSIFEIIIYPTNRTDFSLIESNINSYYSIY